MRRKFVKFLKFRLFWACRLITKPSGYSLQAFASGAGYTLTVSVRAFRYYPRPNDSSGRASRNSAHAFTSPP